jgi:hypothetical protein
MPLSSLRLPATSPPVHKKRPRPSIVPVPRSTPSPPSSEEEASSNSVSFDTLNRPSVVISARSVILNLPSPTNLVPTLI